MSWQKQGYVFSGWLLACFFIPQMAAHCLPFCSLLSPLAVGRGATAPPTDARPQSFEALGGWHLFWVRCLTVSFTGSCLAEGELSSKSSFGCSKKQYSLHMALGGGEAGHCRRDNLMEMSLVALVACMNALRWPQHLWSAKASLGSMCLWS